MSPRNASTGGKPPRKAPVKQSSGMDRARHLEDARHHPSDHPLPHPPHKPVKKPPLSKKHTPHTHPHGEALGPHTDKPSPITPAKQGTRTGTKR